jgi:hypothetical protein
VSAEFDKDKALESMAAMYEPWYDSSRGLRVASLPKHQRAHKEDCCEESHAR